MVKKRKKQKTMLEQRTQERKEYQGEKEQAKALRDLVPKRWHCRPQHAQKQGRNEKSDEKESQYKHAERPKEKFSEEETES